MVFWRRKKAKKDSKKVDFDDNTVDEERDRPSPKRWKSQLIGFDDHTTQPTRQKTMSVVLEKNEQGKSCLSPLEISHRLLRVDPQNTYC